MPADTPQLCSSLADAWSRRVTSWRLRRRMLRFTSRPLLMGIVNVTPDSFSDGARYFETHRAVTHALELVEAGADILDIGGESTRPYSEPVSAEEELRRIEPVVRALASQTSVPLSIDTSKAAVARVAIDLGAEIINDVTALAGDPEMLPLAVASGAGVAAMHMQGTPQTMQDDPRYNDVVADIFAYLAATRLRLLAGGVASERICLDPGIGFGKTHEHNRVLAGGVWRMHSLGAPLLVGHSRKGFIGKLIGDKDADRTAGTVGVACSLAIQGVQIIRVHDVRAVRDALRLMQATAPAGEPWADHRPLS